MSACHREALLLGLLGLILLALALVAHQAGWGWSDRNVGLVTGIGVGGLFAAVMVWLLVLRLPNLF